MQKKLVPIAALGLLMGSFAAATPALADQPGTTSADIVGVVRLIDSQTAEVQARYSCTQATNPDQMHLWVSVKQSANGTAAPGLADPGSGWGSGAAAWSQSHAGVANLICDGHTHVGRFIVNQTEGAGYGNVQKGDAYVQFCLYDATHPFNPEGPHEGPDAVQPVSSMEFVHVR